MAGINLQGGYGAGGAVDALRVLIAENLRAKTQADQVAQEQARLAEAQARRVEDSRQFGVSTDLTKSENALNRGQQLTLQDLGQQFQHRERLGTQQFQTGERLGGQQFQTGERLGHQTFQTGERTGSQDFTAGQSGLARAFTGGENEKNRANQIYLANIGGQQSLQQIVAKGLEDQKIAAMKPATPPNADQNKNQTFYEIIANAIPEMNAVEDKLTNRDLLLINNSPLPNMVNTALLSPEGQRYFSGLKAVNEAWLRDTSGAAINKDEWAQAKTSYGRQIGDGPENVKQKRHMRAVQADALASGAGAAYAQKYGRAYNGEALRAGMGEIPFMHEERIINGKRARWDGQGWEEIK